tara:strand:- start:3234 stop:4121 length:888 start_codon:yes stop_codon:yes gene_type:complete
MIIALTGASGSIGRELTPFLISLGFRVIIISSSSPSNGESIFSYNDLKSNNIPLKVHLVIHLASNNSNLNDDKISDELQLTNTILKSMPDLQCNNLIFFSTAKVYGDNSEEKYVFDEESSLNPSCAYSKAKKLCEEQVIIESDKENYNSIILRLPPVLNQSQSSNLGKLISFAQKGIPLISLAQGASNKRSFISMNNIKTIIEALLKIKEANPRAEIYNLADDEYISLNKLLGFKNQKRIFTLPKFISRPIFKIPFLNNILLKLYGNFMLDNKKLKSHLNVKLATTIESVSIIYK